MEELLGDLIQLKGVLRKELDMGKYPPLQVCLNGYTKGDLKEMAKENGYPFKSSWTKPELINVLEQAIVASFQKLLNRALILDMQMIGIAIESNEAEIDNEDEDVFSPYGAKGYFFISENLFRHTIWITLPYEIIDMFWQWLDEKNLELMIEREAIYTMLNGLSNLYGIFPEELFYKLHQMYYPDEFVNTEMLEQILTPELVDMLPFERKDSYIVHKFLVMDELWRKILEDSEAHAYYIPDFDEVVYYARCPFGEEDRAYVDLADFLRKKLFNQEIVDELMSGLALLSTLGALPSDMVRLLNEFGLVLEDKKDAERTMHLLILFYNHTRKWSNRGNRPVDIPRSPASNIVRFPKIGRNDLCSCGSGKKYKNCCGKLKN